MAISLHLTSSIPVALFGKELPFSQLLYVCSVSVSFYNGLKVILECPLNVLYSAFFCTHKKIRPIKLFLHCEVFSVPHFFGVL